MFMTKPAKPAKPQFDKFIVGERHPRGAMPTEGAVSDFLRSSTNLMTISLANMTPIETKAFRKGTAYGGLLTDKNHICLIWQFYCNKQLVATFDCPFDARLIPDLVLPNMDDPMHHMVITLIAMDHLTTIVKALRAITLPPPLTEQLLHAVTSQLTQIGATSGAVPYSEWISYEPYELAQKIVMYKLGED